MTLDIMGYLASRVAKINTTSNKRYRFVMALAYVYGAGRKVSALEVGPGDGTFAKGFVNIGYLTEVLDIKPRKFAFDTTYNKLDITKGYLPKTFDLVHVGQVLEHVTEPKMAVENIIKMGNINTLFIFSVPNFSAKRHLRTYSNKSFKELMQPYISFMYMRTFGKNNKQFLIAGRKLDG
jgi:2-polyprenyl-3-methyl-5-hydroxy-6-metoxy-1,4-benzoquinol methylase